MQINIFHSINLTSINDVTCQQNQKSYTVQVYLYKIRANGLYGLDSLYGLSLHGNRDRVLDLNTGHYRGWEGGGHHWGDGGGYWGYLCLRRTSQYFRGTLQNGKHCLWQMGFL